MALLVVDFLVVASYAGVGAVSWRVRRRNRIGPLLVAVGLAYLASQASTLLHGPKLISDFWLGPFAQLVVALPTGRLGSPPKRILVGSVYAYVFLLAADRQLIAHGNDLLQELLPPQDWVTLGLVLAFLAVPVVRLSRASTTQRRLVAPIVGTCLVVTGLYLLLWQPTTAGELVFRAALPLVPIAYLTNLVRQRLDRAGVAGMVVRLAGVPRPAGLAGELAAILHDPRVRLGFWSPARAAYVDADGLPLPPVADGLVTTRIDSGGQQLAVLVHDKALLDEAELIEAACAATALALDNKRLQADLHAQLRELAVSRARLVRATETGRRQLERDLHDGVQQRLLAVAMLLGRAERGADVLTEAKRTTLAALDELRALCQGIHPPMLTERGLPGAVRELAETAPIEVEWEVTVDTELSPEVESVAYYVTAEAVTNAVKHAGANRITVLISRPDSRLVVRVADEGCGGADSQGSGLAGLADRVAAVGGSFSLTSPSGAGTVIVAELPCGS